MKAFSLLCAFFLSTSLPSLAAITVSQDTQNKCQIFRTTSAEKPIKANESLFKDSDLYGFTLKNMEIDFNSKSVSVEIIQRVVFGFDRPLFNTPVIISAQNPNFHYLVNHLNRSLFGFDQICISKNHELIWASMAIPKP